MHDAADVATVGAVFTLRSGGALPPIHVFPDIGGNHLYARQAALSFDPARPVLGLRLPGLTPQALSAIGIEALAERFADALEAARPGAPHHLLGHSFAALLAFETACALQRRGARAGVVALIDAPPPPGAVRRAWLGLQGAVRRAWRTRRLRAAPCAQRLAEPGFAAFDLASFAPAYRAIISGLYGAMIRYRPRRHPVRVLVVRAGDGRFGRLAGGLAGGLACERRDLGWSRFAAGGVTVVDVPGDHLSVVRDPRFARQVARAIETAMQTRPRAAPPQAALDSPSHA
jgi:thioesterase domain-containing protein